MDHIFNSTTLLWGGEIMDHLMSLKQFIVLGNTTNNLKYAYKIKKALLDAGYSVSDVPSNCDVVVLCINPIKGLEILKNNDFSYQGVIIQPGAGSEEIYQYLEDKKKPFVNDCCLKYLRKIKDEA